MTLEEWIGETEAERPERALWPSETDARRFRDVWCTGRERLESNAWNDEDAVAFWWLVKSNGSTVTVTERDEVLRGRARPGNHAGLVIGATLPPALVRVGSAAGRSRWGAVATLARGGTPLAPSGRFWGSIASRSSSDLPGR